MPQLDLASVQEALCGLRRELLIGREGQQTCQDATVRCPPKVPVSCPGFSNVSRDERPFAQLT